MPLPRFEKLPPDKQERILSAAAKVFAEHGYEKASLNLMLEGTGISKGAAYYYFADKADLVGTVIRHYWLFPVLEDAEVLAEFTEEEFWRTLSSVCLHPLVDVEEQPWRLGLSRAVWTLPKELLGREPLRSIAEESNDWMAELLRRGRELGLVRSDLPDGLLVELIETLDGVHDRWLASHWEDMDRVERVRITAIFVTLLKKILAPQVPNEEDA